MERGGQRGIAEPAQGEHRGLAAARQDRAEHGLRGRNAQRPPHPHNGFGRLDRQ